VSQVFIVIICTQNQSVIASLPVGRHGALATKQSLQWKKQIAALRLPRRQTGSQWRKEKSSFP